MTRGADQLPVSDHAVLRYLERVCAVDIEKVRRHICEETSTARSQHANGSRCNGIVYRLKDGYVTTCFVGDPIAVRFQNASILKKILRTSRNVPILSEE
jgi:hypothetical protein